MIKIANRFKPFSHTPGVVCCIPKSSVIVEAFPTLIKFSGEHCHFEVKLFLTGPVKDFTQIQDLEKDCVLVFGHAKEGYFSFQITHVGDKILFKVLRGPDIKVALNGQEALLKKGSLLELNAGSSSFISHSKERLSLGVSKKLDWDLVWRRKDLAEVLPVLFQLGQKITSKGGVRSDLSFSELERMVKAGLTGILVPCLGKSNHLGVDLSFLEKGQSVSTSLRSLYESIRSLFIQAKNAKEIAILPNLPEQFPSGRLKDVKMDGFVVDLEWTKRKLRRMSIQSSEDMVIRCIFPKELKRFRLKTTLVGRGETLSTDEEIFCKKDTRYFLDKFEK